MVARLAILSLFVGFVLSAAENERSCPALSSVARAKLIQYVQKKYNFPPASGLTLADVSVVGSSCYRKLLFKSSNSTRPGRVELFLSPDFRYLTRELMDINVDPVAEARRKEQALVAGLASGNSPVLGPSGAPVTLTLFSDFQCPYCADLARTLKNDVLPIEGKNVRLVFRHLPLARHNWARKAAHTAACGQSQGNRFFWGFHDFMFEHQKELTPGNIERKLTEHARKMNDLDHARFRACLANGKQGTTIDRDVAFANENGINGTPTLFVNGRRISSTRNAEEILTLIREQVGARGSRQ
jgi:protein-disulfide isomerase